MALVTKSFSDIITFTRASTGTFFNSAGVLTSASINAPRFDYNPSTLAAQGLLIEEARTNRILYSEDFGDASWVKTGGRVVVTTNQIAAPDGTVTADFLEANGGASGSRSISQTDTSSATGKSQSVFAKAGTATFLQILYGADTTPWANFDLSTGTVGSTGTVTSATITPVGNGWYRCQVTTASTTATSASIGIVSSSTAVRNESNTLSAGLYIWGLQLEAGAFPTSYIPTTTTALTRSADVASVNTLAPWFNSAAGTLFAEYSRYTNAFAGRIATFSNGTNQNQIRINASVSTNIRPDWQVLTGGSVEANVIAAVEVAVNAVGKTAGRYATNDFQQATNGTLGTADTIGTVPSVTTLHLGGNEVAGNLNGWLRRLTFYPRPFVNADLQAITA